MFHFRKSVRKGGMHVRFGFTLTELLVVVIVLGVLAGVSVPKLSRVLETRKTTEAEEMLSAVRSEQEQRCVLGKTYLTDNTQVQALASASNGKNYTYSLQSTGASASSGKGYTLRMPSYKNGQMCCEGAYCDKLNKSYPSCSSLAAAVDECAGEMPAEQTCEENPNQEKCCNSSTENWNGSACVAKSACELSPNSCSCESYADEHACECKGECTACETDPNSCSCETYAEANACECNPSTETCCSGGQVWNDTSKQCEDACTESTAYIGAAGESDADTCDGDASSQYTCDGTFKGTCVDVYSPIISKVELASFYAADPFLSFKNSVLLASRCVAYDDEGRCLTTPVDPQPLCPDGSFWNASTQLCERRVDLGGNLVVEACQEGFVWNSTLKKCVREVLGEKICQTGYVLVGTECVKIEVEPACTDGYVWNGTECVRKIMAEIYREKRSVTCCGPGGGSSIKPIDPIDPDPEPEPVDPCVLRPNSCDCTTYALSHRCECNPSASTCCTAEQIKGGMVFNASTKSCSCPSGLTWDSTSKTCKGKYTCWAGVNRKSINVGNPGYGWNEGNWEAVHATTAMDCNGTGYSGWVSCKPGQNCDCEPGKKYLWYETYGLVHSTPSNHTASYTSKYVYYCLTCKSAASLSDCPTFTIPNPANGGSDGGYEDRITVPSMPEQVPIF